MSNVSKLESSNASLAEAVKNQPDLNWTGSSGYVWLDINGSLRNGADLGSRLAFVKPNPAVDLTGISGAVMIGTGTQASLTGMKQYETATRVDDFWGRFSGAVLTVRGGLEATAGVIAIPMRSLNFAATVVATKTVLVASKVVSGVGTCASGFVYAFLMIPFIVNMHHARKFGQEFDEVVKRDSIGPRTKSIQLKKFFEEKTTLTKEDAQKIFEDIGEERLLDDIPELSLLTEQDKSLAKELSKGDAKVEKHLTIQFAKCIARKRADVERSIGSKGVNAIDTFLATNILDQHEIVDDVIENVQKANFSTKVTNAIVISFCVFGIIAAIVSLPIGGPAWLAIMATAFWVVSSIGWLVFDGYFIYQAFQTDQIGKWDKLGLFALSAVFIGSIALASIFTGGLLGFAIIGTLAISWAVFSALIYYNIHRREELAKKQEVVT